MGSLISLGIEEFELDWGKNYNFQNHSKLFAESDKKEIMYYYEDEEKLRLGYSAPLKKVLKRLELLGYSLENTRDKFDTYLSEYPDYLEIPKIKFDDILQIFSKLKIEEYIVSREEGDYDLGEYVQENIFHNKLFKNFANILDIKDRDIAGFFENLDTYVILRLIMENDDNLNLNLEWRTYDVIEAGWADDNTIYEPLDEEDKFLLVTEGTSDTYIIQKSIEIINPEISDFFSFVDMEENYPFSGAGSLYNFCKGLSSIRIQNKTLIIFDNDLEGIDKYEKSKSLTLPKSMKIMRLPDLDTFKNFPTIGPLGDGNVDINGKAVAIECFLDLSFLEPTIRWTNYKKEHNEYQGALEKKDRYVREFKKSFPSKKNYDTSKIEVLLKDIYQNCI